MEESMFYVILSDSDSRLYRHRTLQDVTIEALRLADKDWHKKFFILKAKYVVSRATQIPPPAEVVPVHRFTIGGDY